MAKHLLKNAAHIITVLAFVLAPAGCSKSSAGKKKTSKPKSEFSDRRRPRDNMFIQEGGYSKKPKVNPFVTDDSAQLPAKTSQNGEKVVYEKPALKADKAVVAPVAYNTGAMVPKRNFFRALFTKIASLFPSRTSTMTQVASRTATYRPLVNKMVMDNGYVPDHRNLIEQGSYDDGYLSVGQDSNILQIEPTPPIESKSILVPPILKTEIKKSRAATPSKPIVAKAVLTSADSPEAPVVNLEPAVVSSVIENTDKVGGENLEQQLASTIEGLVNVSKLLYGINVDGKAEEYLPDVNIPDISDDDLKNSSGKKQQLADVPPVPGEISSQ